MIRTGRESGSEAANAVSGSAEKAAGEAGTDAD